MFIQWTYRCQCFGRGGGRGGAQGRGKGRLGYTIGLSCVDEIVDGRISLRGRGLCSRVKCVRPYHVFVSA